MYNTIEGTVKVCSDNIMFGVDSDTEILTKNGWKKYYNIQVGELVANYNVGNRISNWGKLLSINKYKYNGKVLLIKSRCTHQILSLTHPIFTRSRHNIESIVEAKSLLHSGPSLPISTKWFDTEYKPFDENFAELVGWIMAEGCFQKNRNSVFIYQSEFANPKKVKRIEYLLNSCSIPFKKYYGKRWDKYAQFYISGDNAKLIKKIIPNKQLPMNIISDCDLITAKAILRGFIGGDGHIRKNDGRISITQKNKQRIESIQFLAIRCGFSANLSRRTDGYYALYLSTNEWLTIRGNSGRAYGKLHVINYDGIMWYPTVETGFWIARSDGKPFITGSMHQSNKNVKLDDIGIFLKNGKPEWKLGE